MFSSERPIIQIAYAVKDIREAATFWSKKYNIGPFYLNEHIKIQNTLVNKNQNEIVIQSDKQTEINDVIYAEGNVSLSYRGKLLKADNLTYDKLNKQISAKGNILIVFGDQIFKVEQ